MPLLLLLLRLQPPPNFIPEVVIMGARIFFKVFPVLFSFAIRTAGFLFVEEMVDFCFQKSNRQKEKEALH